jgi:hypothetical protein
MFLGSTNWRRVKISELDLVTHMTTSTSEISSNASDIRMDVNSLNLIQEPVANQTFCSLLEILKGNL